MDAMQDIVLVTEAARILRSSPDNVRRLERRGVLVAVAKTASGVRLFARGDVERLAAVREVQRRASMDRDASASVAERSAGTSV
jgi:DNA-binding transcriptional MerR regulator